MDKLVNRAMLLIAGLILFDALTIDIQKRQFGLVAAVANTTKTVVMLVKSI